jgi:putative peptidoglycan lipid II flippase
VLVAPDDPVRALAYGALLGGLLQVAAQWPALRRLGYAGRPVLALDPDVREVLRRIAPLTFGIGIYYVDLVLSRRFLSELGTGAQSYFSWAMRLCDFPQGIFVMALSTAALPSLSTLAARGAKGELAETWAHGMRLAMFVAVPASVALVVVGGPIVATLFERGAFDAEAARETARALAWQGGAIWTVAAVRQIVPAFYALGDTRTPVIVSAVDLAVFVVLALVLRGPLGHVGISMAVAGSSAAQMALLLLALRVRLPRLHAAPLLTSMARTTLASLLAAGAGWLAARAMARGAARGGAGAAAGHAPLEGLAAMVAFAAVFLVVAWLARSPELREIADAVRRRLRRSAPA